jgi:hypothetical protein
MRVSSLFVASLMCALSGAAMSQTDASISLPDAVVGAPKHVARLQKPQQRAVAHSTVLPRTSIATASAAPVYGRDILSTTTGNCSTTTWPTVSPVQCTKPVAHSYVECSEMVAKTGARPSDAWWWCSNQGFRN